MYIIYKDLNGYCATAAENYAARVTDARKIIKLYDFKDASDIINYFCMYCGSNKNDFKIVEEG
jgi:hypothetical protein